MQPVVVQVTLLNVHPGARLSQRLASAELGQLTGTGTQMGTGPQAEANAGAEDNALSAMSPLIMTAAAAH